VVVILSVHACLQGICLRWTHFFISMKFYAAVVTSGFSSICMYNILCIGGISAWSIL